MFNSKLIKLFRKIQDDSRVHKELAKCKTKEQLYSYCQTLEDGYTQKELDEFLKQVTTLVKHIEKMPEGELEKISGGKKKKEYKSSARNLFLQMDVGSAMINKLSACANIFSTIYFTEDLKNMDMTQISQLTEKLFQDPL